MVLDDRLALDGEAGGSIFALVGSERVEDRHIGEERCEELIAHQLELEGLLQAAAVVERDAHRDQLRHVAEGAGDGRRPVLLHRADHFSDARDLDGRHQARQERVHVSTRHRETRGPEVVERMPEGVDPVAVDVGHRSRAG